MINFKRYLHFTLSTLLVMYSPVSVSKEADPGPKRKVAQEKKFNEKLYNEVKAGLSELTDSLEMKYWDENKKQISLADTFSNPIGAGVYSKQKDSNNVYYSRLEVAESSLKLHMGVYDENFQFKTGQVVAIKEEMDAMRIKDVVDSAARELAAEVAVFDKKSNSSGQKRMPAIMGSGLAKIGILLSSSLTAILPAALSAGLVLTILRVMPKNRASFSLAAGGLVFVVAWVVFGKIIFKICEEDWSTTMSARTKPTPAYCF